MSKTKLREGGIYTLNDKREFVVCKPTIGVGYPLYQKADWQRMETPDYRVHEDGRLSRQARMTHWRITHLTDTGRTLKDFRGATVTTTASSVSSGQQ